MLYLILLITRSPLQLSNAYTRADKMQCTLSTTKTAADWYLHSVWLVLSSMFYMLLTNGYTQRIYSYKQKN